MAREPRGPLRVAGEGPSFALAQLRAEAAASREGSCSAAGCVAVGARQCLESEVSDSRESAHHAGAALEVGAREPGARRAKALGGRAASPHEAALAAVLARLSGGGS
jgi:hypothetical protein